MNFHRHQKTTINFTCESLQLLSENSMKYEMLEIGNEHEEQNTHYIKEIKQKTSLLYRDIAKLQLFCKAHKKTQYT